MGLFVVATFSLECLHQVAASYFSLLAVYECTTVLLPFGLSERATRKRPKILPSLTSEDHIVQYR